MNVNWDITGASSRRVLYSRMAVRWHVDGTGEGKGNREENRGGAVRTELPTGRSGRIGIGILIVAIKPNYVDNGRHGERPFRDRTTATFTEFNGRVINKGMRIARKSSPSGRLATASLSHLDIRPTPTIPRIRIAQRNG